MPIRQGASPLAQATPYLQMAGFLRGAGMCWHPLVLLLFSNGLSGFLRVARGQIAALLALVAAHPVGSAIVAAVLLVVFLLSMRAEQDYAHEGASPDSGPLPPQPRGPPDDVWLLYPPDPGHFVGRQADLEWILK